MNSLEDYFARPAYLNLVMHAVDFLDTYIEFARDSRHRDMLVALNNLEMCVDALHRAVVELAKLSGGEPDAR